MLYCFELKDSGPLFVCTFATRPLIGRKVNLTPWMGLNDFLNNFNGAPWMGLNTFICSGLNLRRGIPRMMCGGDIRRLTPEVRETTEAGANAANRGPSYRNVPVGSIGRGPVFGMLSASLLPVVRLFYSRRKRWQKHCSNMEFITRHQKRTAPNNDTDQTFNRRPA